MIARKWLAAVAIVTALMTARSAVAQECPCDCYFSSDCETGNFCNWGSLPDEDTCFWRTPKPQGQIGAGCEEDYNNWGQCDGICSQSGEASHYSGEDLGNIQDGIAFWSEAMSRSARLGGGYPDPDLVADARSIGFRHPGMSDSMWRVATEVHLLTRGDVLVFPDLDEFHSEQVRVTDLSNDPLRVRLGDLGIAALLAEIDEAGAGRSYVDRMAVEGIDALLPQSTLDRVCPDGMSNLDCLYMRLADVSDALARGGRDGNLPSSSGGGGCEDDPPPPPPGCAGDANEDEVVDVEDLVLVIQAWAVHVPAGTPGDVNDDLSVDIEDLVMLTQNWGPCEG